MRVCMCTNKNMVINSRLVSHPVYIYIYTHIYTYIIVCIYILRKREREREREKERERESYKMYVVEGDWNQRRVARLQYWSFFKAQTVTKISRSIAALTIVSLANIRNSIMIATAIFHLYSLVARMCAAFLSQVTI